MGGFDERNDDDDIHIPLPRPVDLDDVFGVAVEQFARREELPDRPEPNIYEERLKEENVINFGIDFKANKISFSESLHSTIEYKDLDIMDKDLFREICKYSKNQFGCLCLCLDNSYKNQKRKEMVENGKDYGFLNIQILDSISSKCLAMLLKAKNELQNDQVIWTVCEGSAHRYIWRMINFKPIFIETNTPNTNPDIILCDSFDNEFFIEFDKNSYSYVRTKKVEEFCCAEAALMQAHSIIDKSAFSCEKMILDRDVYFGISEQKVVNLKFKTLPHREIIKVYNTEKFFIYDDSTEKTIINFRGDTDYIVTIDIDGNGIFTLKYDETSSEGRQNNEKWFENFIRGQNSPQIHIIPQTTPSADKNIKAVGIDFGTSKCCVATSKRDGIEVVAVENTGGRIMPSYVAFDEKHTKCGQIVVDRLPYKAAFSVFDLKRIIGKEYEFIVPYPDWPFQVLKYNNDVKIECKTWNDDIQQQSPEEILSVLLKHLKVKTEEIQGESLEEVVITVPGTFTQRQINSTFEAACQAGWTNISFLPEPIAALFTYFEKYPSKNFTGCVFDLGGGNLNVWIFKIKNGKIVLLNNDGDTCIGGRNFDKALFTYLYARLKRQFNIDMTETKKYKLITDCLVIKHSLSTQNEYTILIDDYQVDASGSINISRLKFKALTVDLIIKIKTIINKTLSDINSSHSNVSKIFYVGGASRMPIIIEMLTEMFPACEHICDTCPDEIVAIGAAHYSYYLKDDNINEKILEMEEVFSVLSYD